MSRRHIPRAAVRGATPLLDVDRPRVDPVRQLDLLLIRPHRVSIHVSMTMTMKKCATVSGETSATGSPCSRFHSRRLRSTLRRIDRFAGSGKRKRAIIYLGPAVAKTP
jgi:hypothetical protein